MPSASSGIPSFFHLDVPTSRLRLLIVFKAVFWRPLTSGLQVAPRRILLKDDIAAADIYI